MANLPTIEEPNNTYTLKNISELYNIHHDVKKVYHFQYKSEKSANNFGNLPQSLLDKDSHHMIHAIESHYVTDNKKNLIMKSTDSKIGSHTIAYDHIPENYRFDIIDSTLDGKTLVIYDKAIKKPDEKTKENQTVLA